MICYEKVLNKMENTQEDDQHFNIKKLFKLFMYHFRFGDTLSEYTRSGINENPRLTDLLFDSHPGPIDTVIEDAKNLHKSVFLYIYFTDNAVCQKTDELFHISSISTEIERSFIFYPISVTSSDGYSLATHFKFKKLPIIALIRPRGHTFHDSSVFLNHEGFLTESGLLSYISLEHPEDTNIIQNQDQEFLAAVAEAEQNNMRIQEIENQAREEEIRQENQKKQIEEEYNQLPKPQQNEQCFTIKFHFPDNTERMHAFPIDGTIKMIFIYVRYYLFPSNFTLRCGYPQSEIDESEDLIQTISNSKQFVIYVDIDE